MKAVILAAGMGKRLRPLTNKIPKAFINIGGFPIIHHTLDNLKIVGITSVVIVTGYKELYFKEKLGSTYRAIDIIYISNEEYEKTGSMYSLSKIEDFIDDDILLLESDLLFEIKALDILLNSELENVILVSEISKSGDEVFICVDDSNRITDLGKHLSEGKKKDAIGELIGISKFSKEFLRELFKKAKDDYSKGKLNYHYEECAFETSKMNSPLYALLIKDLSWIEIDKKEDLKRAEEIIYPHIEHEMKI